MAYTVVAGVRVKEVLYKMLDDCIVVIKRILVDYRISGYVLMGHNYMVNESSRHLLSLSTIF